MTPKRTINVKKVRVVAQSIGGLYDYLNESENRLQDEQITVGHRILMVDPGFYSLYCVMVSNGQIQHQSSGTTSRPLLFCLSRQAFRLTRKMFRSQLLNF